MNTATMRRLDRTLGSTMCGFLTLLRRAGDAGSDADVAAPERIVLVKLAEQGAWVVASSAIRDAIDLVGREQVYVVTFSENRPVLDLMDLIPPGNVIEVSAAGPVRTLMSTLRAVARMRRSKVDTAIDLEFFARSSAILCYLSGARWRVGFHRSNRESAYRGDLHTHRLSFNPRLHVSETYRSLIAALGADPALLPAMPALVGQAAPPDEAVLTPSAVDRARQEVERLLGPSTGTGPRRLLLLNANAGDLLPLRRWPEERYVELAQLLLAEDEDRAVLFTGGPAEAAGAVALAEAVGSDRCASIAGRTTIPELVALFSMAEVLVTNDSGPAHYAALAPIDVITLFGPESPAVFGSLSPRNRSLTAGLPCSPCVNAYNDRVSRCGFNACMQALDVGGVHRAVVEVLAGRRADARMEDG